MTTKQLPKRKVRASTGLYLDDLAKLQQRALQDAEMRLAAATTLQTLLDHDKDDKALGERETFLLSTEQRHALHVAVGVLRKDS